MNDFSQKVTLGRTGLAVSRLGIGSAYGVSEWACREAFDAGINYFFWGSVRTAGMAVALQDIARARREELVIVLECYTRHPRLIARSVENGLNKLGVDYADILLLGWYDNKPTLRTLEAVNRLKDRGLFRFLGISSHQRALFQSYLHDGCYDVFHVRYNAAHPGAEQDIFPYLPSAKPGGPGIVAFTSTRWGDLLKAKNMPPGDATPSASTCYRFVLSNPHVHVAICGPRNNHEMREALTVLNKGPLNKEEWDTLRRIGDHVHGITTFMSALS